MWNFCLKNIEAILGGDVRDSWSILKKPGKARWLAGKSSNVYWEIHLHSCLLFHSRCQKRSLYMEFWGGFFWSKIYGPQWGLWLTFLMLVELFGPLSLNICWLLGPSCRHAWIFGVTSISSDVRHPILWVLYVASGTSWGQTGDQLVLTWTATSWCWLFTCVRFPGLDNTILYCYTQSYAKIRKSQLSRCWLFTSYFDHP